MPVSHAAVAVAGDAAWIVGGESRGALVASVQMLRPNRGFGTAGAPGAGSPYFGARLLVADRGNNRLLLLDDTMHLVWKYPSVHAPRDPLRFYFPDDAFFIDHGTAIISNQEQNDTIIKLAYPSGKIIWSYGHPRQPGTAPGHLHEPDDAYLLKNGQITVADANNCRVLVINPNHTVAHQIGANGVCVHNPAASMGSPNGDTPLPDGNLLISEINGSWVSEYTLTGRLVWTTHLPISYPSDPQQLGPDRYLIADYARPGQILEFNRAGHILYRYHPASGPGYAQPPLADRTAAQRRLHGQRRLQQPHGGHRSGDRGTRLAVRRHRQEGPRAGQTAHPRRLRPAVAERIDANTPHNRMKIRVRGQLQTTP